MGLAVAMNAGVPSAGAGLLARLLAHVASRSALTLDGAPPAPAAKPTAASPVRANEARRALATKILYRHFRERHRHLGSAATVFGELDETQTELLIRAAVAASRADGLRDAKREPFVRAALAGAGLVAEDRKFLATAMHRPVPLESLLAEVRDPTIAALFYAASLVAIDKHEPVNRAYLAFLAARLKVPQETLARLHTQFGYDPEATP